MKLHHFPWLEIGDLCVQKSHQLITQNRLWPWFFLSDEVDGVPNQSPTWKILFLGPIFLFWNFSHMSQDSCVSDEENDPSRLRTIFLDFIHNVFPLNVFREFSNFYYVLSVPKTFSKQLLRVHTNWENCANKYDRNIFWISRRLKGLQCRTQPKEKLLSKLLFLGLWIWLPILSFVISKN